MKLKNLAIDSIPIIGVMSSWGRARRSFHKEILDSEDLYLEGKSILGSFLRNFAYGVTMTAVQAGGLYAIFEGIEYFN